MTRTTLAVDVDVDALPARLALTATSGMPIEHSTVLDSLAETDGLMVVVDADGWNYHLRMVEGEVAVSRSQRSVSMHEVDEPFIESLFDVYSVHIASVEDYAVPEVKA